MKLPKRPKFWPKDRQFQVARSAGCRKLSLLDGLFGLGMRCRGYQMSLKKLECEEGASGRVLWKCEDERVARRDGVAAELLGEIVG